MQIHPKAVFWVAGNMPIHFFFNFDQKRMNLLFDLCVNCFELVVDAYSHVEERMQIEFSLCNRDLQKTPILKNIRDQTYTGPPQIDSQQMTEFISTPQVITDSLIVEFTFEQFAHMTDMSFLNLIAIKMPATSEWYWFLNECIKIGNIRFINIAHPSMFVVGGMDTVDQFQLDESQALSLLESFKTDGIDVPISFLRFLAQLCHSLSCFSVDGLNVNEAELEQNVFRTLVNNNVGLTHLHISEHNLTVSDLHYLADNLHNLVCLHLECYDAAISLSIAIVLKLIRVRDCDRWDNIWVENATLKQELSVSTYADASFHCRNIDIQPTELIELCAMMQFTLVQFSLCTNLSLEVCHNILDNNHVPITLTNEGDFLIAAQVLELIEHENLESLILRDVPVDQLDSFEEVEAKAQELGKEFDFY